MSEPAASGGYRKTQEAARTTLSKSTHFQTLIGAANEGAALALIYRDVKGTEAPPFARVILAPYKRTRISEDTFDEGGTVRFIFEVTPSISYTTDTEWEAWFCNALGDIVDDLADLSGTASCLMIQNIQSEEPRRNRFSEKSGKGEYWEGVITAEIASA